MLGPTTEEIWYALVESVKLQSHYATLLNQRDGGERMTFADPNAWIQRLREVRPPLRNEAEACKHLRVERGANVPRVYGSWRTQACIDCGAFRTHGHNDNPDPSKPWPGHAWRPASDYTDAIVVDEEG